MATRPPSAKVLKLHGRVFEDMYTMDSKSSSIIYESCEILI